MALGSDYRIQMHRVWHIPELVSIITSELPSSAASALARTSKALFYIAIESYWSRLGSLRPLSALIAAEGSFPGENSADSTEGHAAAGNTGEEGSAEVFPQWPWLHHSDVSLEQEDRLKLYASRVKSLQIAEIDQEPSCMQRLLCLCDNQPIDAIFTRLADLGISARTVAFTEQALRFTTVPTLLSLGFCMMPSGPSSVTNAMLPPLSLAAFLPPITHMPRLDALHVYEGNVPEDDTQNFLTTVTGAFPDIKELSMRVLPMNAGSLTAVGSLQKLALLHMYLKETSSIPSSLDLPVLVSLDVMFRSPIPCLQLFSSMHAPKLRSLELIPIDLRMGGFAHGTGTDYLQLSQKVAEKWPLLRQFGVRGAIWTNNHNAHRAHALLFDSFRPLLACHFLEQIEIETNVRVCVTDDDLQAISKAWPRVRRLKLTYCSFKTPISTIPYISRPPRATLKGLLFLAENCRELKALAVSLNLTDKDASIPSRNSANPSDSSLSCFDAFDSPPCEPEVAAPLLTMLFPHLTMFGFAPLDYTKYPLPPDQPDPEFTTRNEERVQCMRTIRQLLNAQPLSETGTFVSVST